MFTYYGVSAFLITCGVKSYKRSFYRPIKVSSNAVAVRFRTNMSVNTKNDTMLHLPKTWSLSKKDDIKSFHMEIKLYSGSPGGNQGFSFTHHFPGMNWSLTAALGHSVFSSPKMVVILYILKYLSCMDSVSYISYPEIVSSYFENPIYSFLLFFF